MAFSPNGTRLAMVAGQHGAVFDLREGGAAPVQFKHGGGLQDLDWSPDGARLLTAGLANDVRIWDVATGEQFLSPLPTGKSHNRMARWSADGRFVVSRSDDNVARVWNAATAEAVTPLLLHSGNIRWVCITPGNRLITASEPNLLRAWDLHATRLPAAVVADYARLLAGRKLDRAGVLQKLDAAELGELGTALRSAQPELFTTSTQELYEWHRRQVQQPTSLARVTAGLFHLERCAELASADSWVKEQQARFLACRLPARDPATPANLVDLSASYTHSFDLMPEGEFAELPRGEQELAGTLFDLRGLVRLETANYVDQARANGRSTLASFPLPEADDIAVGRRCRQLHFLQASDGDRVQAGDEVARWRIHFVDGSTREFPVIFGQHVEDWWVKSNRNQETDQAVVAWEGKRPAPNADQVIRLYKCTWKNPLPDTEISRLDFVIGKVSVRPFVVAVTSE